MEERAKILAMVVVTTRVVVATRVVSATTRVVVVREIMMLNIVDILSTITGIKVSTLSNEPTGYLSVTPAKIFAGLCPYWDS